MTTRYPELPSNIGKPVHTTDAAGSKIDWTVLDEILRYESDDKVLVFQRLQRKNDEKEEMLRLGYFIIGTNGQWRWGRFAPFISAKDFSDMSREVVSRRWNIACRKLNP